MLVKPPPVVSYPALPTLLTSKPAPWEQKHQQRLVKEGCASKTFKQNIQNLKVQETAAAQGPAAFNLIIHESNFLANKFVNPFNIS